MDKQNKDFESAAKSYAESMMNNKAEALRENLHSRMVMGFTIKECKGVCVVHVPRELADDMVNLCAEVARSCVKERCKYRSDVIGFEIIEDINKAFGVSDE